MLMNTTDKTAVAFTGRSDEVAVAIRMKAARLVANLSQKELANAVDRQISNVSNVERAKNLPGWGIMLYFHHAHRIDVNFLMTGNYAQLPGDVQSEIFPHLVDIVKATNLLDDSHRPRIEQKASEA